MASQPRPPPPPPPHRGGGGRRGCRAETKAGSFVTRKPHATAGREGEGAAATRNQARDVSQRAIPRHSGGRRAPASLAGEDHVLDDGVDLVGPAVAAKH